VSGHADGTIEKINAAGPGGRIGRDERWLVLLARIEEEAGTGFDDALKSPSG
jgi:hypothetical protein